MVKINKQALELTKQACHQELNKSIQKYNTNHFGIIRQFLKKDFQFLLWLSLIELFLIFISLKKDGDISITTLIVYFGVLGAYAIFEYIKADYYQTKDLISISYLNQGRSFLYTSGLFTIFEFVSFIGICLFLPYSQVRLVMAILCALVPILFSQIMALLFMKYISHLFGTFVAYLVSYGVVSMFFYIGDVYEMYTLKTSFLITGVLTIIYIVLLVKIYKERKERKEIWNWY